MATGRGRRARTCTSALVTLVALALLAGCTSAAPAPSPSPTPSPSASPATVETTGDRIAVVVPPASMVAPAEAGALLRAARALAASAPPGVADVRVVKATSTAFARDLAELAVDDGYDVVCVVGTGSAELVLELARARRETRFCTTDGRVAGGPVNLVAVGVDPAALVQAGAIAIGTAPAPVGLLLTPQLGDLEALVALFTSSVAPPTQPAAPPAPAPDGSPAPGASPAGEVPSPSPTSSPSPPGPTSPQPPFVTVAAGASGTAQTTAGEELAEQRPSNVLVLATPGGVGAAMATTANGAAVVSVADWVADEEGEPPANLLVGLTVDWARLLTEAITAARADEAPQVQLLGAEALGAFPGQLDGAVPAAERTTAFLEQDG